MSLLWNMLSRFFIAFLLRRVSINFMAAVTLCSDFGAQEKKICQCFHFSPICLSWSDEIACHGLFFPQTFYWRIIALQNFALFCQTSTWISHRYTYIPSFLKLLPISLPIPPFRLLQRPCLSFLSHIESSCWLSILHMVMQISMLLFPYSSPSPPLSPCP